MSIEMSFFGYVSGFSNSDSELAGWLVGWLPFLPSIECCLHPWIESEWCWNGVQTTCCQMLGGMTHFKQGVATNVVFNIEDLPLPFWNLSFSSRHKLIPPGIYATASKSQFFRSVLEAALLCGEFAAVLVLTDTASSPTNLHRAVCGGQKSYTETAVRIWLIFKMKYLGNKWAM